MACTLGPSPLHPVFLPIPGSLPIDPVPMDPEPPVEPCPDPEPVDDRRDRLRSLQSELRDSGDSRQHSQDELRSLVDQEVQLRDQCDQDSGSADRFYMDMQPDQYAAYRMSLKDPHYAATRDKAQAEKREYERRQSDLEAEREKLQRLRRDIESARNGAEQDIRQYYDILAQVRDLSKELGVSVADLPDDDEIFAADELPTWH